MNLRTSTLQNALGVHVALEKLDELYAVRNNYGMHILLDAAYTKHGTPRSSPPTTFIILHSAFNRELLQYSLAIVHRGCVQMASRISMTIRRLLPFLRMHTQAARPRPSRHQQHWHLHPERSSSSGWKLCVGSSPQKFRQAPPAYGLSSQAQRGKW